MQTIVVAKVRKDCPLHLDFGRFARDPWLELRASETTELESGVVTSVRCNFAVLLPREHWAVVLGNPELLVHGLFATPMTVPNEARYEIAVYLFNNCDQMQYVNEGESVGHMFLMPAKHPMVRLAGALPEEGENPCKS